ncbi:MAG: hypothetical protein JXX29_24110 [Deltaproteobacteria bacterium]|nr:hypothetical protein [Deltaproteobacteria bacterium]MBN2674788.1 hypothetical protein [Deltaproteobacteria bacterium]
MQQLSKERLEELTQCSDISGAAYEDLIGWVRAEPGIDKFAPDAICRMDPRNQRMVVYNAARSKRPHDNKGDAPPVQMASTKPCPICEGNTTRAIDVAPLKNGYTFINKNLFPCFYRTDDAVGAAITPSDGYGIGEAAPIGNHYLQWTSTVHNDDWFNMDVDDLCVVLTRLGVFEKQLLTTSAAAMPDTSRWHGHVRETPGTSGFVSIMKNYGAPVGGSLVHGHQQITHSNVMSRAMYDNWRFLQHQGMTFSAHMLEDTPDELRLADLGETELLVPYFMRRPLGAMLFLKNDARQFLHQLNDAEIHSLVNGISKTVRAYHRVLPAIGRDVAYNVLFHTGPGAGLYIEFIPFTQETGGMEQLGLWVCQDTPEGSASVLRSYLND